MDKTIQEKIDAILLSIQELDKRITRIESLLPLLPQDAAAVPDPEVEGAEEPGHGIPAAAASLDADIPAGEDAAGEEESPVPPVEDVPAEPEGVPAGAEDDEPVETSEDDLPFAIVDDFPFASSIPSDDYIPHSDSAAPGPGDADGILPVGQEDVVALPGEDVTMDLADDGGIPEAVGDTTPEAPAGRPEEEDDAPVPEDLPVTSEDVEPALASQNPDQTPEAEIVPGSPDDDEDMPLSLFEGMAPTAPKKRGRPRKNINEAREASQTISESKMSPEPWRTDRPGSEVKNVRSAIALIDRVVFINTLFRGDALLYNDTLDKINSFTTLEEVVDYLGANFPEWNMGGDEQYKFMMAVRRKVRK